MNQLLPASESPAVAGTFYHRAELQAPVGGAILAAVDAALTARGLPITAANRLRVLRASYETTRVVLRASVADADPFNAGEEIATAILAEAATLNLALTEKNLDRVKRVYRHTDAGTGLAPEAVVDEDEDEDEADED